MISAACCKRQSPGGPFNPATSYELLTEGAAEEEKRRAEKNFYDALVEIAEQLEPEVQGLFLDAVKSLRASVTVEELVEALKTGIDAVDVQFSWTGFERDLDKVKTLLLEGAQRAIDKASGQIAKLFDFNLNANTLARRASRIASDHGASLVTNVTKNTREAIKQLAGTSLAEGETWEILAKRLRGIIGLDRVRAGSFEKFILAVQDEVKPNGAPLSVAEVQRRIDAEYKRLIKDRAETIARTETWDACQSAQLAAWEEAKAEGFPIEGLGAEFVSSGGERYFSPPRHPRCRCAQRLRRQLDEAGNVFYVREWILAPGACEVCQPYRGALAQDLTGE